MGIQIVLINGRVIEFEADEIEYEDGTYFFTLEGKTVAQFQKNNIAGFYKVYLDDEEDED